MTPDIHSRLFLCAVLFFGVFPPVLFRATGGQAIRGEGGMVGMVGKVGMVGMVEVIGTVGMEGGGMERHKGRGGRREGWHGDMVIISRSSDAVKESEWYRITHVRLPRSRRKLTCRPGARADVASRAPRCWRTTGSTARRPRYCFYGAPCPESLTCPRVASSPRAVASLGPFRCELGAGGHCCDDLPT